MSKRGTKGGKSTPKRKKAPLPISGSPRKRAKVKPNSSRAPSRKRSFFVLALIALSMFALFTYFVVDARITRSLASLHTRSGGLLSDSVEIYAGSPPQASTLIGELNRRAYHQRDSLPEGPGEYRLESEKITVWPRDFASSATRPTTTPLSINLISGEILNLQGKSSTKITLEPVKLSDINSRDVQIKKFIPLKLIPKLVKDAVISIEDERFYSHAGFDLYGIMRAAVKNLLALRLVEGGSTLTQQLAKNLFLSPRRTFWRKFLELFSAISLERNLSKDQILELYLNEVYLGQDGPYAIHGIGEAAQYFFGVSPNDLTVAQIALLAGIIKAPSGFSPRKNAARATIRRNIVISKLLELGIIDQKTAEIAKNESLKLIPKPQAKRNSPHLLWSLKSHLSKEHSVDLKSPGLAINTGIDPYIQSCADLSVESGIRSLEREYPRLKRSKGALEVGLVAIEPHSGKVRAWVGGRDYKSNQFDHVYQAKRPVGSTIKPFVYLAALDTKLNSYKTATAQSILPDSPITIAQRGAADWTPENYDRKYRGDVTLRYALEHSLNLPTVYLAQKVGFSTIMQLFRSLDLFNNRSVAPSMVLGAFDSSLLDLVGAYSTLANGGIQVKPRLFLTVSQHQDDIIASTQVAERVISSEGAAFVLTNILQGVIERGTATKIRTRGFNYDAAGKTGTTDDARDAWFVGYTSRLLAGIWLGFDDNSRIGVTGGVAAAPIWGDFMKCVAKLHPPGRFLPPRDVIRVAIDSQSGEIATSDCPSEDITDEYYVLGTEPRRRCALHGASPTYRDKDEDRHDLRDRDRNGSWWDRILGW